MGERAMKEKNEGSIRNSLMKDASHQLVIGSDRLKLSRYYKYRSGCSTLDAAITSMYIPYIHAIHTYQKCIPYIYTIHTYIPYIRTIHTYDTYVPYIRTIHTYQKCIQYIYTIRTYIPYIHTYIHTYRAYIHTIRC